MSGTLMICDISDELMMTIRKFRFRKSDRTNAIILKIGRDPHKFIVEEELMNCTVDEIRDSLPSQQPRFVLISYILHQSDGRTSNPLCLVFYSPQGCNPEMQMLYAGSHNNLVNECALNKNIEIRDLDELNDQLLHDKLGTK